MWAFVFLFLSFILSCVAPHNLGCIAFINDNYLNNKKYFTTILKRKEESEGVKSGYGLFNVINQYKQDFHS